jgi:hypothetical protein
MHNFVGYTVPLSDNQVFTLLEFGELKWISPVKSICKWEFILHTYESGEVQYEALVDSTIFIYTEAQLQSTKACQSGSFKEQDDMVVYHLSDYDIYNLQVHGEAKLWDADYIRIGQFLKINLGGNYKNIMWVGDILVYYYDSDRSDIDCPY